MALKHDEHTHAGIMLAYALCTRCAAMYWEESGETFFQTLRESVCASS